jgi:CubicO group peptidase (beta-lactamase class C family)
MFAEPEPQPDSALARRLAAVREPSGATVAAAVVALGDDPPVRIAIDPPGADVRRRFEIGSVTKGLTGMLLADAVTRGEITLQTTAAALAPSLARTRAETLTLGELCTHRSGLSRLPARLLPAAFAAQLRGANPYAGQDAGAVLAAAGRATLRGRGSYRYSNLGGALTGQLLARAAGSSYERLLTERVLQPLDMSASAVVGEPAPAGRSASGRRADPWILGGYAPAGGVASTIADLARLLVALLDGSAPGVGALKAVPGATGPHPGSAIGMFWIREGDLVWHNGMTGGYSSFVAIAADRRHGVAVLADVARGPSTRRTALALSRE